MARAGVAAETGGEAPLPQKVNSAWRPHEAHAAPLSWQELAASPQLTQRSQLATRCGQKPVGA